MAQKVQIILEDDLSGGAAEETVRFALDGVEYQIDLNTENAEKLREALKPFISVAMKTNTRGRRSPGRSGAAASRSGHTAKVRAWAKEQGFNVSDRGRIHQEIFDKYAAAHNS
ncbi:Lsr2 family protein [Falsarthrobacter nasiphocae]|uniref:Lsr2 family protein n=1 Tax=Falsarthrobacter nasiphocae TaxID=189863 RepID=A0AAE3YGR8_9MICC|nr:Lsr2 family protein [Falsarthrobacter nasiphocae]MDR6891972.1 hypothetical protein [Falsarthrobacter nasiphocae]